MTWILHCDLAGCVQTRGVEEPRLTGLGGGLDPWVKIECDRLLGSPLHFCSAAHAAAGLNARTDQA